MTKQATVVVWQNRIVGYGEESVDALLFNSANWRVHPKNQQDALLGILQSVGVVQNIIVSQQSGAIIDGHLRATLAMRDGQETIPVTYVDLSPEEEALVLATFDPISTLAVADKEQLDALLSSVNTGDAAVQAMLSELATENGLYVDGEPVVPEPSEQKEPQLESECFIEIYCSQADLADFQDTLNEWSERSGCTINIS